jgi:hypothetical protein
MDSIFRRRIHPCGAIGERAPADHCHGVNELTIDQIVAGAGEHIIGAVRAFALEAHGARRRGGNDD